MLYTFDWLIDLSENKLEVQLFVVALHVVMADIYTIIQCKDTTQWLYTELRLIYTHIFFTYCVHVAPPTSMKVIQDNKNVIHPLYMLYIYIHDVSL